MEIVLLTALGVGGATLIGAGIGFAFKNLSHKFSDVVLAFAAGVMLAAAVVGLIIPSLEYGGKFKLLITIGGIFAGAICLSLSISLCLTYTKWWDPILKNTTKQTLIEYCFS